MFTRPLPSRDTLNDLLAAQTSENRHLDFKREVQLPRDANEMAKDVSAFANTDGGELWIGVAEDVEGRAADAPGLDVDRDEYSRRIQEVVRSRTSPPLTSLRFHEVPVGSGKWVFVVRVERSWIAPHMLTEGKRCYIRDERQSRPMEIDELRAAVLATAAVPEKLETLRQNRLDILRAGYQFRIEITPAAVIHIVPVEVLGAGTLVDVRSASEFLANARYQLLKNTDKSLFRYTVDGVIHFSPYQQGKSSPRRFAQFFRRGYMEVVQSLSIHGPDQSRRLDIVHLEQWILRSTEASAQVLVEVGMHMPMAVMLTLIDVGSFEIRLWDDDLTEYRREFEPGLVRIPPVVIDDTPSNLERAIRPLMDMLWQAAGHAESQLFDAAGKFKFRDW